MLSFENEEGRRGHAEHYLPKVEIKDYSVKISSGNFFDQPISNDSKMYENIGKIAMG